MINLKEEYNLARIFNSPEDYRELLSYEGYLIYRIRNLVNNKSYIGDTFYNLQYRLFDCIGSHFNRFIESNNIHLYNSMRLYGLCNFVISIIYDGEFDEDLESKFIKEFNSFENGYNNTPHGKPFHKRSVVEGRIRIYKDDSYMIVDPKDLDYYLSNGYQRGLGYSPSEDTVWMFDGCDYYRVPSESVSDYLANGYQLRSPLKGKHLINNGEVLKRVSSEDLPKYLSEGWVEGSFEYRWMCKDSIQTRVYLDEVQKYLDDGYEFGRLYSPNEGKVAIHDENSFLLVDPEEVESYLMNGYQLGNGNDWCTGRIWVHLDDKRTRVKPDELDSYLSDGWILGFGEPTSLGFVGINNGSSIKRVPADEVESYLSKGWRLGEALDAIQVYIEDDPEVYSISTKNQQTIMKFAKYGAKLEDGTLLEDTDYYRNYYEYPSKVYTLQGSLLAKYYYQLKDTGKITID